MFNWLIILLRNLLTEHPLYTNGHDQFPNFLVTQPPTSHHSTKMCVTLLHYSRPLLYTYVLKIYLYWGQIRHFLILLFQQNDCIYSETLASFVISGYLIQNERMYQICQSALIMYPFLPILCDKHTEDNSWVNIITPCVCSFALKLNQSPSE